MENFIYPAPKESSYRGENEIIEDVVFVAVGKEVEASKLNLLWAIRNCRGLKICIFHIQHVPDLILFQGDEEKSLRMERAEILKGLEYYHQFCAKEGVKPERLLEYTHEAIEQGIVDFVTHPEHRVGKLVMGAASDSKYTQKMTEPISKKAIYVWKNRPAYCNIWFICKGNLICTAEDYRASSFSHGAKCPEMMKPQQLPSGEPSTSKTHVDSETTIDGIYHFKESEAITYSPSTCIKRKGDKVKGTTSEALLQAEDKSRDCSDPRDLGSGVDPRSRKAFEELLEEAMAVAEKSIQQAYEDSMKHVMASKLLHAQDKSRDSSDPRDLGSDVNRELFEELEKANAALKFQIVEERRKSRKAVEKAKEELEKRREAEEELAIAREELEDLEENRDFILEELAKAKEELADTTRMELITGDFITDDYY